MLTRAAFQVGGLPALIELLRSRNKKVQAQGVVALRNLSVNADNKVYIVDEGALPPLIALLRSQDENIQEQACGTIWSLSVNADNRPRIVQVCGLVVHTDSNSHHSSTIS